ncbi:MAG: amidase [Acidobacteriota bacterium]
MKANSLTELASLLQAGEVSAIDVMQETLRRVDATHESLNAVTHRAEDEPLLEAAAQADERLAAGKAGPLEGLPLGVKDLEDVAGMPTSKGSRFFEGQIAERDSTQVARLRAAGAIPVVKTNTPEFGFTAISKNLPFGTTRSPWNLERTPGGSSGGSAALLSAGVLPLVTSSDGGGSIRIPASFVGAVGLKTSFGRVPMGPSTVWNYGDTSVYGPLTKTVADAALFLDVVAGPSPYDPNSLPAPSVSYREVVQREPGPLRIGYSRDLGYAVVQPDVANRVDEAVEALAGAGHEIVELDGGPPNLGSFWGALGNFELAGQLHEQLRESEADFTRAFARGLRGAWEMTPELWGDSARKRMALNNWCAELFETVDLLVTPTVPYDPPPAGGPFPEEIGGRAQPPAGVASFTIPFNLSGHPALTLRAGLSDRGLPVGVQLVAPRHRDDLALQVGSALEGALPVCDWPEI